MVFIGLCGALKVAGRQANHWDQQTTLLELCGFSTKFQVSSFKFIKKLRKKIQNRMYHCSQLAIAIRGEQWLDTK